MPSKIVIISGANGYFGSIACHFFQERGWKVLRVSRGNDCDVYCDLDNPEDFSNKVIVEKVDLFIHAAAAHEVTCRERPYKSIFCNVAGTKAALDFCVNNKITSFAYISTFHIYGNIKGRIDESEIPVPDGDYALSHLQAEEYVNMYARQGKIKGLVIRPSNFFGIPRNMSSFKRWTLVPLAFCKEAILKNQITLKTSGSQQRNFVSVEDVCRVIEVAHLEIDKVLLLNVYGPDTISIRSLSLMIQETIRNVFNENINIIYPKDNEESEKGEDELNYTSKTLRQIYVPQENIRTFVEDFCRTLRENA